MRRALAAFVLLTGCLLAGVLAAVVFAATPGGPTATTTGTGTTGGTTAPPTEPPPTTAPPERTIAAGVTVGGVAVGGLDADAAKQAVAASFQRRLVVVFHRRRFSARPGVLGANAGVDTAVGRALKVAPGTAVFLPVSVSRPRVRAYVGRVAKRIDREPVDALLRLVALHPVISPERPGRAVRTLPAARSLVSQLLRNVRRPIRLYVRELAPTITRVAFGPIIVIRRGSNHLYLYNGVRLWRVFGVATGQAAYPTPLGRFQIVVMWRNPWWYPPNSSWARGSAPIPPGPGNPLGTRWMGLSAPGVGIHGTPNDASIGYSASHGCIRMHIPDAEWLFNHVRIGTPVFIVPA